MRFLLLYIAVVLSWNNMAVADIRLSGQILDEAGTVVKNFTVRINDDNIITGKNGKFSLSVPQKDILGVQITADGYYPIIHSFSVLELSDRNDVKIIPPITLVTKKKGRVMLAFGGDTMMARRYLKPRAGEKNLIHSGHMTTDTKEIVRHIKPYFENADFGSVNLETQVMAEKPKGSSPKSITFFSPPETVDALAWAGIDYVTLGNNHTFDNLQEGLKSTLDILKKSPLAFSGAGLNEEQALKAHRTRISGMPYSFLGYVGWKGGSRPHQAAEGENKGGAALGSTENIIRTVDREVAKDQITVVQYHGSLEYSEEPTLVTEQRLKTAIDRGADLAIAHHPHVVQGFEIYKDRLIAYSLGNFIFDQYYYAPQFSYLLYVWMDGEKFHRAEVVPVHIKGYKPTPAVGRVRNAVLKRVASLSSSRNITLGYSGGHGVITHPKPIQAQKTKETITLTQSDRQTQIIGLDHCNASNFITGLESNGNRIQYRLGQELLRRGDFESFDSFDAPERGWLPQNNGSGAQKNYVYQGQRAFKTTADKGKEKSIFGMKVFTRIYKAGNPMSFAGQVYGEKDAKLDIYLQRRPNRWGLRKSLTNGPKQHLGSVTVKKGHWQKFIFDFNTPRVGTHSLRILVEASAINGKTVAPIYYDNVELIEWQTAYRETDDQTGIPSPNRITHIGIKGAVTSSDKLELLLTNHANSFASSHQTCQSE